MPRQRRTLTQEVNLAMPRQRRTVLRIRFKKVWQGAGPWELAEPFMFPMRFKSQKQAIWWGRRRGRAYLKDGRLAQLVVHGRLGQILFENTYGKDPRKYQG